MGKTGSASGAPGPRCSCRQPRFDLDGFGRLFIPDAIQGHVEVADTNGNTLCRIGKRGREAKNLEFRWPLMVAASDDHVYVADYMHQKVIQVKLDYAVIEDAGFAKP